MKNIKIFGLIVFFLFVSQGCVRVAGTAGYWRQGADDPEPQGKQVGFDTNNLAPQRVSSGKITTE